MAKVAARTRSAKLAAKRGRPKLPANTNTREPNGRLSRRNERTELLEHEMISTVAATRVRHLHLVGPDAMAKAADERYGYLLGRIRMDGKITDEQHAAGRRYAEDMARYYGLTGVPFPSAKSSYLFSVKPWEDPVDAHSRRTVAQTSEERTDAARKAVVRRDKLRDILLATGDINTGRRVIHTVNAVCVEDLDHLRDLNPPMLAWLKAGLNTLVKFYGAGT